MTIPQFVQVVEQISWERKIYVKDINKISTHRLFLQVCAVRWLDTSLPQVSNPWQWRSSPCGLCDVQVKVFEQPRFRQLMVFLAFINLFIIALFGTVEARYET